MIVKRAEGVECDTVRIYLCSAFSVFFGSRGCPFDPDPRSRSRHPEQRACYRAGYTEPSEKPVPVGHAGRLCLLQDAERAFGVSRNDAAPSELGDDVSLPGDGLFTYRDVPLDLRETGAYQCLVHKPERTGLGIERNPSTPHMRVGMHNLKFQLGHYAQRELPESSKIQQLSRRYEHI